MKTSEQTLEIIISTQGDEQLLQYIRENTPALNRVIARSEVETCKNSGDYAQFMLGEVCPDLRIPPIIPQAAIRHLGQTGIRLDDWCICADPVYLTISRYGQLLEQSENSPLSGLSQERIDLFFKQLDLFFRSQGLTLRIENSAEWYIFTENNHRIITHSMDDVIGQDISPLLLAGLDKDFWLRLVHEFQMWCHHYFLNENLVGVSPVTFNSIWLWGEGSLSSIDDCTSVWNTLFTDSIFVEGVFRLSGKLNNTIYSTRSVDIDGLMDGNLVVLNQQVDHLKKELTLLENVWLPMIECNLKNGKISELVIIFHGQRYSYKKNKWFQFWH